MLTIYSRSTLQMFAFNAIYRRDILQEKMEIENFLDVLYYNVA